MLFTSAKIFYGFEGWVKPPPLTHEAKHLLCESPVMFHSYYGDYYIEGEMRGAYLNFYMDSHSSTKTSGSDVSASLKAGFSAAGNGGSASAKFSDAMKKSKSMKNVEITVSEKG